VMGSMGKPGRGDRASMGLKSVGATAGAMFRECVCDEHLCESSHSVGRLAKKIHGRGEHARSV
jgi:hypothetical protein